MGFAFSSEGRTHPAVALLAGGVGGARLARGFAAVCPAEALTVVVNVGDDDDIYGVTVSPDLDTMLYTLAGMQGPEGWGVAGDTRIVMEHLAALGLDTSFMIGDRDLATNLFRTAMLRGGATLTEATRSLTGALGVRHRVLPATDDRVPTRVQIRSGEWLSFQDYFVRRRHTDDVAALRFDGAERAEPAPGVVEAIGEADLVVIAPSNPPLSIWPMLSIPAIRTAVEGARPVIAVSPLIGGKAVKGPADRVMASLGLSPGSAGVVEAYAGLIDGLVVDTVDAGHPTGTVEHYATDTRIAEPGPAASLATFLLGLA